VPSLARTFITRIIISDSKRMIHDDENKNMRYRTIFGNPLKDNALRCPHRAWLEAVTDHFPRLYHPFAVTDNYSMFIIYIVLTETKCDQAFEKTGSSGLSGAISGNRDIPVLRSLAQSGWEPVTFATAVPKSAIIERFGGENGRPLFFTVRNTELSPRDISITIDIKALGVSAKGFRVTDVLTGKEVTPAKSDESGSLSFSLRSPAQTTIVLGVQ